MIFWCEDEDEDEDEERAVDRIGGNVKIEGSRFDLSLSLFLSVLLDFFLSLLLASLTETWGFARG